MRKWTDEEIEAVKEMYEAGYMLKEIEQKLGMGKDSVRGIVERHDFRRRELPIPALKRRRARECVLNQL